MSTPVYLPPELPPYLKSIYDLKPIVGTPSDDEVIGIHAVIRMAQKAVDIPGTGDPALLSQLYEHLFDIQIAKYRNRYLSAVFPETTIYTSPTLPAHVAVQLEPVTGAPYEEEVMKVQSAIRSYDQFANAPTLFDPRVGMELSQHLFDIQMVRANECHVSQSVQHPSSNRTRNSSSSCTRIAEQSMAADSGASTNNAGVGTGAAGSHALAEGQRGIDPQNAIERLNQLVEQTNQLIERSNRIAERANQLVDKCSHPAEQSNKLLERFSQLFERLNEHLDQSNRVIRESMQPVEKIGDVLGNINRVLVRIQHAIVRPPELPLYLRNVYDLKPIVGVPSDADVVGVHAVIQAANRASGIPGMHDSGLLMGLADHLFSAQMAKYRSKYSLVTFPSDATYTPPELPAHVSVILEPVSGAPSDDEMTRVQEALRFYQQFGHAPSMFDAHVNMELSQHLFNIQMARYMRIAGECHASPVPQTSERPGAPVQVATQSLEGPIDATNNAGTGASATRIHLVPQSAPGVDVRELMERSNQLADRFNQLLERSNELVERCSHPAHETGSQVSSERFNQVLERLTQLIEQSHQPAEQTDRLSDRFDQLFERFNRLVEQSNESTIKANELADRANQLAEKHNESSERSNRLSEQANKSWGRLGDVLRNINRVLVRTQHAIVRNHKGNTIGALDCLVNEKGQTPLHFDDQVSAVSMFPMVYDCCSRVLVRAQPS
ncbi:unnamed protein product [Rhizoctonia solani]|nr:unnamed protein product [Rhizoctonia solani]